MKIPRGVSGARLADLLRGCILETDEPTHHRIAIPDHHSLRLGTFSSILRAAAQHKGVQRDTIIAGLQATSHS